LPGLACTVEEGKKMGGDLDIRKGNERCQCREKRKETSPVRLGVEEKTKYYGIVGLREENE